MHNERVHTQREQTRDRRLLRHAGDIRERGADMITQKHGWYDIAMAIVNMMTTRK